MPVINGSTYVPPWFLANGHLQTLLPTMIRRVRGVAYQRERITMPDNDCLDLDWARAGSRKLAVLAHGLEGDSKGHYILGIDRKSTRLNSSHGYISYAVFCLK